MRRVTVFWWGTGVKIRVGELAQARNTPVVFEWDRDFLSSWIELSPLQFPKRPGLLECPSAPFDGLPGLFADHVPDGWGRVLFRRGLEQQGIGFDDISPLDMLQYIGDRGMGALSFEPSLRRGESWAEGQIDLDRLERGVEPILSGTPSDVLDQFLLGGASPNGIRPKIIAKEKAGKMFVGQCALDAAEWLIKFRAPGDSPEMGKIEYLYSLMAGRAGLNLPKSKLFETKKGTFFGTQRFDRNGDQRIHMHTLSGILGVAPGNFSVGYEHFAKVAIAITKDARAIQQVFKLAVFNVLTSNQDDHSRNVAFLMNGDGVWTVAPAYDLTFYRTQSGEHKMPLYGKGAPTLQDLRGFAIDIGLSKPMAKQIIEQILESVAEFNKLAKHVGLSKKESQRIEAVLSKALGTAQK